MRCAWQEYLGILPHWMRWDVDRLGKERLQELRLRIGLPPELVLQGGSTLLNRCIQFEDLQFVINSASQYSPWVGATAAKGYITAPGGHRVGICGSAVTEQGRMRGIRDPSSVCIRTARDFPGIAKEADLHPGSLLIVGPPGSGKTTLLRDLIRLRSTTGTGSIAVVDERGELFPRGQHGFSFSPGPHTDVLQFTGKSAGISAVLKTMGPSCIAVDEITGEEDCTALQQAGWCGVLVFATVHAFGICDLLNRPIYRTLAASKLFHTALVMQPDKSWHAERIPEC